MSLKENINAKLNQYMKYHMAEVLDSGVTFEQHMNKRTLIARLAQTNIDYVDNMVYNLEKIKACLELQNAIESDEFDYINSQLLIDIIRELIAEEMKYD